MEGFGAKKIITRSTGRTKLRVEGFEEIGEMEEMKLTEWNGATTSGNTRHMIAILLSTSFFNRFLDSLPPPFSETIRS